MEYITCCLLRLNQYRLEESDGEELSIYFNGKRIWPKQRYQRVLSPVTELNLRLKVEKEKELELVLCEHDWYFFRRRIGKFSFKIDGLGGPFNTDISLNMHKRYNLEWVAF